MGTHFWFEKNAMIIKIFDDDPKVENDAEDSALNIMSWTTILSSNCWGKHRYCLPLNKCFYRHCIAFVDSNIAAAGFVIFL